MVLIFQLNFKVDVGSAPGNLAGPDYLQMTSNIIRDALMEVQQRIVSELYSPHTWGDILFMAQFSSASASGLVCKISLMINNLSHYLGILFMAYPGT